MPINFVNQIPDLPLAYPFFYRSSQIDGADILPAILLGNSRYNICESLLGQETILRDPFRSCERPSQFQGYFGVYHTRLDQLNQRLEILLTKFWKMINKLDSACECNVVRTTTRKNEGRYVVTLWDIQDP